MPQYLFPVLIVVQVLSALAIILLVLMQQGKGADMGSSFGGGSAGSLFGSAGSANFFSRLTKWVAVLFFISTLGLAYVGSQAYERQNSPTQSGSVMEGFSPVPSAPVVPGADNATPSNVPAAPSAVPTAPSVESTAVPSAPTTTTPEAVVPAAPAATPTAPAESSNSAPTTENTTN